MAFYILMAISIGMVIYGAAIFKQIHVPFSAKQTVEPEFLTPWCKTEGVSRMLLGIDISLLAMYMVESPLKYPALVAAIVLAVYITKIRYNNNAKYLK